MLFGALTLTVGTTVTSCKDYDDDIKNLQEQIDKVTSTNPVSTEDMKTAISSAIQTLQTQLQTAIDGKADAKAVQDLLKTVEALQTALDKKADASTIKTLGDQITELSTKVNSIDGTLTETKRELEAKVADLTEKLAGAASSEELEALAGELSEAKNKLATVTEMADNNAAAIVSIQADILELQKLDGRITALETFNQNAASKDDLADYVAHSELAGLVDDEVLELLKDNGSIAKYVNDAIESQVLAEASAINLSIKGVDGKLATLSSNFDTYKQEQATAYQTVTGNITTLTSFKTAIEAALTDGGYDNFAAVLTEISTIKESYGYCATKEAFDGKVEAYLTTYKSDVDKQFTALETRIKALENQIQSVVYIPEYEDGQVKFMSYYYGKGEARKVIAQADPIQVKFRISPATAAANFVANYTPSFDAQEIKTRAAEEIYSIEGTPEVDEATGIVTYTLSTTTDKSYAISLNLKAKDATKNLTDISSNYFPVIADYRVIETVKLYSPNESENAMLSDNSNSKIDYGTGAKVLMTGKDRAGKDITDEPISESAVKKSFVVEYKLIKEDDHADFTIEKTTGILELKTYPGTSGHQVTAQAEITMKDAAGNTVSTTTTKFAKVTASNQIVKTVAVTPSGLDGVEFKSKGEEATVFDVDLSGKYSNLDIEEDAYKALKSECFNFETGAVGGIKFAFKENTTTNDLTVVVPAGTPADTYEGVKLTVTVSPTQKFTITANATVQITKANYDLSYNTDITSDGAISLNPVYTPNEKPESVSFTCDLKSVFSNYIEVKAKADEVGASIKFVLNGGTSIAGVTLSEDNVLTIDGSKYKRATAIPVVVTVVGKNTQEADVTLSTSPMNLSITPASLAGTWTKTVSTPVKIGSDNLSSTFDLANGFSWTASNGKKIWDAGKVNATDWAVSSLEVFGVARPTFTVAAADQQYVSITEAGVLSLTETGKLLKKDTKKTITVTINAAPGWGTITDYESNRTVTVLIQLGTASDLIATD
ncbi:hypothetical protein [Bacteroides xylanisolvens]